MIFWIIYGVDDVIKLSQKCKCKNQAPAPPKHPAEPTEPPAEPTEPPAEPTEPPAEPKPDVW